ncbi:MAG TPA: c-type cytochrome biogenesis protein CcmI [Gammaproteobacteria bacterium]|nr:c-type cytochrome biogenesis protein CcmI [Gammaproteobacteria bacterium]
MNIIFWAILVVMLLVAISLLVYPLIRVRGSSAIAYKDSNLQINADKLRELDEDLEEGRIDQAFYQAAREELDRELLIDIPEASQQTAAEHYVAAAERHPAIALLISVFVPMLALLLYLQLGMHSASDETQLTAQTAAQKQAGSIEEMTQKLQARVEANGGTVEEWTMLARAHKYLGELELAAAAYAAALEQDSENAQLMLERAEVMALNNERRFNDESRALVMRAYELQPDNPNVLWFAGYAEFQYGNYRQAIDLLTRLLPMATQEEEVVKSIVSIISQSRDKLIAAGEEVPPMETLIREAMAKAPAAMPAQAQATPAAGAAAASQPAATGTRLQVSVTISDEARSKFNANDAVFVYAKAKQGPRMPLAVKKMTLADLPATVTLDDSMAMMAGMNISAFDQLVVSARVTKTGSAIASSGDYIGQLDVQNDRTESAVNITINKPVP